jgi:acyl-CoA thioesterase II
MFDASAIEAALTLERTGPDRYRGTNLPAPHGVVFGGQLMAQAIVAALDEAGDMAVKTLHTVFPRSARPDIPLDIAVDRMHAGRTFASTTVTISQEDRICTRSVALLTADEPDFIRHADAPARLPSPEDAVPGPSEGSAWEVRIVDAVDVNDPDATGPAELDVWTRFVGVSEAPAVGQALLSYATDGFLIGTAMRPHAGVGQVQAHQTVATGVVGHTLTFHEPVVATEWLLLSHRSPYAGHGRSYGRADVFRANGDLVASFVQDAMIRSM